MPSRRRIATLFFAFLIGFPSIATTQNRDTQEVMWKLSDAIAYLLPFSVRDSEIISDLDQSLLEKHLGDLRQGTAALVEHAKGRDDGFELLAKSFSTIAKDIEDGFKGKWPAYSYYSLSELTQHCVACHSRLPGESVPMLGQKVMARINTDDFDTWSLVNLLIATREFDSAMNRLEKEMLDPSASPAELEYSGLFITYLRVAINVNGNVKRPHEFFGKFLERDDIPYYLSFRITKWREFLLALGPALKRAPSLESANKILSKGALLTQIPGEAIRAVHDLTAATMLQKLLDSQAPLSPQDRAEAYFNLGLIALRTFEVDFSVPELEYLFVAAINADPKGALATSAYRYLEEFGYIEDKDAPHGTGPLVQRVVDLRQLRINAGIPAP